MVFNPAGLIHRQRVLGSNIYADWFGRSLFNEKIAPNASCHAVIAVDDTRGENSLEKISRASLEKFSAITILDLKVIPDNYKLLSIKNDKGESIFSDTAREFAQAELGYAIKILPALLSAPELCLIANFDISPYDEKTPYSRARQIIEMRKNKKLDTKIIQLSGSQLTGSQHRAH